MIVDKKKITETVGGQQRTKWVPNLPNGLVIGTDYDYHVYRKDIDKFELHFTKSQFSKIEVLAFNVKIILNDLGIFNIIESAVESSGDFATKMKWNTANTFNRYDPLIMSFEQQLNLDLDEIWASAIALQNN